MTRVTATKEHAFTHPHPGTLTPPTPTRSKPRMRIVIMGAGGLGGYFGARLAAAGNDVAFVARGAHLAAIRQDGLRVTSARGDLHLHDVIESSRKIFPKVTGRNTHGLTLPIPSM